jgi:hypothetical protein
MPKSGEVLWFAKKGNDTYRAELRDETELGCGVEFRVTVNGHLSYSKRHEARFLAEAEARYFSSATENSDSR